jgi:methylenetetrahydrofolate dehydrogenase (NADP+)/methenyltetrahydrofolate cyclohydrolase
MISPQLYGRYSVSKAPIILAAKPLVTKIIADLKLQCQELKQKPNLHVFLVGDHPPSLIYTRNKKKFIEKFGGECSIIKLDNSISEKDFLDTFKKSAQDPSVHGLFVQLPLPKHLCHIDVGQLVPQNKDVDGFHASSLHDLMKGETQNTLVSCTPKGIMSLLAENKIEIAGKNVVIVGRSMIVGKPMALLMTNAHATVTLCHSRTQNLASYTQNADIIISAVGKPRYLNQNYLLPHQKVVLIDVGINHDENGELCGDIDFDHVQDRCEAISPVPGGVGPLTIASLGQNLVSAAKSQLS